MIPLVLALAVTASVPTPAPSQRQLSVTGTATVTFKPNRVNASMQITAQGRDEATVRRAIEERVRKLHAGLQAAGVGAEAIVVNAVSLSPQYRGNEIVSQYGSAGLFITLSDMGRVDEALAAAVKAGATPVSVSVGNTDHARYEAQARLAAASDARERAKSMLEALGAKLGLPATVSDSTPVVDQQPAGTFLASPDGKVSSGFATRELKAYSQVSVRFDIDAPN